MNNDLILLNQWNSKPVYTVEKVEVGQPRAILEVRFHFEYRVENKIEGHIIAGPDVTLGRVSERSATSWLAIYYETQSSAQFDNRADAFSFIRDLHEHKLFEPTAVKELTEILKDTE